MERLALKGGAVSVKVYIADEGHRVDTDASHILAIVFSGGLAGGTIKLTSSTTPPTWVIVVVIVFTLPTDRLPKD
jgi:hypothetical protein